MSDLFESRNMEKAVFRNVNLQEAEFNDVNLQNASVKNANLKDFSIDDANIEGMTIFGIRVDQLLSVEFDRRDPERVRLRMSDPCDPESVRGVMKHLDELREDFGRALRTLNAAQLSARPNPDQWSVIEIVRHLVFAEDMYINHWIYRNETPWLKLGLVSSFLERDPKYATVGSEPTDDLEIVLAAWQGVHRKTQEFVAGVTRQELLKDTSDVDFGQGCVGRVLQGLAQHDLVHIREAEALIARFVI